MAKNFVYNLRGSKYNEALPQGGRAGSASALITREDQREYRKACKTQHHIEGKEFKQLLAGKASDVNDMDDRLAAVFGDKLSLGNAVPEGWAGKGPTRRAPRVVIGHGRRNPNEVKRK